MSWNTMLLTLLLLAAPATALQLNDGIDSPGDLCLDLSCGPCDGLECPEAQCHRRECGIVERLQDHAGPVKDVADRVVEKTEVATDRATDGATDRAPDGCEVVQSLSDRMATRVRNLLTFVGVSYGRMPMHCEDPSFA